jgi:hypothetical protein
MAMKKLKKSLRRIDKSLLILFILLGFVQCDLFDKSRDKEETFDPYVHPIIQKGDTLIFKSEAHIDSIYVKESQVYGRREYDEDYDEEAYWGFLDQMNCNDTCLDFHILIREGGYYIYYNYPLRDGNDPYSALDFLSDKDSCNSLQIVDVILNDLFEIDFTIYKVPNLFLEVTSCLYSKTYGFVQYTCFDGEEFIMSEETLEMLMSRE